MDELYNEIITLGISIEELKLSVTPAQRAALDRYLEAINTAYEDHLADVMDEAMDDVPDLADEEDEE